MNIIGEKHRGFKEKIILFENIETMMPVEIVLPDPPSLNKIENRNISTANQKFIRTTFPKRYSLLPQEDKDKFARQEMSKRINGFWFYNNGDLTYITGQHYMYLNWWKLVFGYPEFRVTDQEYFLHWKKRVEDPLSYGLVELSSRQSGKSAKSGFLMYEIASRSFNFHAGIQSKNDADAKSFFKTKIAYGWRNCPNFFQPKFDNSTNPETELKFSAPALKTTEAKEQFNFKVSELNSLIDTRSAVETAYDNTTLGMYVADEIGKGKSGLDIYDRWRKVKPALTNMTIIRGKSIHTTTVEDIDKDAGRIFKKFWEDSSSEPDKLNALGQTITGVHQHFTPAYKCMVIDEFGRYDIEASKEHLSKMMKNLKGSSLSDLKRKYPQTIRDCFAISGKDCHFNAQIIDVVLERYVFGNKDVVRGNFMWKDGIKNTIVEWFPTDNGKFLCSYVLPSNKANMFINDYSMKIPANTHLFCAGGDPYAKKTAVDSYRKSKGAGAVFRKRDSSIDNMKIIPIEDYLDIDGVMKTRINHVTERFCCTYMHRPPTMEEYGEDMLMMCFYYGCQMFPETNVPFLDTYFEDRGYGGYLFHRTKKKTAMFEQMSGQHTTEAVIEEIFIAVDSHIELNGLREVHDEWLEQAKQVDDKMTRYDLFVACGYALLANKRKSKEIMEKKYELDDYVNEYNHD